MTAKATAPTNDQQRAFFDQLIENGGNVKQAADNAGYSTAYAFQLAKKYGDWLRDQVHGALHLNSIRAAKVITDTMDEDGKTPAAKLRMEAAKDVLDRAGIVKNDKMQIEIGSEAGVILLPAKKEDNDDSHTY